MIEAWVETSHVVEGAGNVSQRLQKIRFADDDEVWSRRMSFPAIPQIGTEIHTSPPKGPPYADRCSVIVIRVEFYEDRGYYLSCAIDDGVDWEANGWSPGPATEYWPDETAS